MTILTSGWPVPQQQKCYIIGIWRGVITVSRWRYDAIGGSGLMGVLAGPCRFHGLALRGLWFAELPCPDPTRGTVRHDGPQARGRLAGLLLVIGFGNAGVWRSVRR